MKKRQKVMINAADSTRVFMYSDEDLRKAIEKYGVAAKNGVIIVTAKH